MKENELEAILNQVGGFTPKVTQQVKAPSTQQAPITSLPIEEEKRRKKQKAATDTTAKVYPNVLKDTSPKADPSIQLEEKDTRVKKRARKTKQDMLLEMATTYHGNVMGKKYTSSRNRKVLLRFIRIVFPNVKNFQIIDFLLLQSLAQNKHLLPANYMDIIQQEGEEQ